MTCHNFEFHSLYLQSCKLNFIMDPSVFFSLFVGLFGGSLLVGFASFVCEISLRLWSCCIGGRTAFTANSNEAIWKLGSVRRILEIRGI